VECRVHKLVADVALFADRQVLLVRYRDARKYDGQSGWFLPDDCLAHAEHPDAAATRILQEQVGLFDRELLLNHIESFDGDGSAWHLVFHYHAELGEPFSVVPGSNVRDAEWFELEALPPRKEMAHGGWAADVLAEVRRRLELQG